MKKYFYLLVLTLAGLASCTKPATKIAAIDKANMDLTVKPSNDFDQYANGGWKKSHPIPSDRSSYGTMDELTEFTKTQMRSLIDEIIYKDQEPGSVGQKIADFYNSVMDTAKIEEQGINPIQPFFDKINAIKSTEDMQSVIAEMHTYGIYPLFGIDWFSDMKNSDMVITYMGQSGLGLPDRDYYLTNDLASKKLQNQYKDHLKKMFVLLGIDSLNAKANVEKIYAIEYRLAQASMSKADTRDPLKIYNKYETKQLAELVPAINWSQYFQAIGITDPNNVVVAQPLFMAEMSKMIKEVSLDDWKVYLQWNVINSMASCLNASLDNQNFEFYDKILSGQQQQQPRWKRAQSAVSGSMSEAIGQLYVAKYFPPEAKQRMITLVENLKTSLGERIKNVNWMTEATKQKALDKLAAVRVKIGYPDKWRDYSGLEVKNDSYAANVLRAEQFAFRFSAAKMNKPKDKSEWDMPPQMVNAYYSPYTNEIVFPAAILQPPFFYKDADDAVNYGGIGVAIGHEMSHGFDNLGRHFDKNGNMTDWWTEEDSKQFNDRTEVLVKQADDFVVADSLKINGRLTLGENIADFGGLNIAYSALKKVLKGDEAAIDGFTPNQRFFIAYAHLWAENMHKEALIQQTKTDEHPIGHYRSFAPLRNMPEFYQAFDVREGDAMFIPEAQRAVIW